MVGQVSKCSKGVKYVGTYLVINHHPSQKPFDKSIMSEEHFSVWGKPTARVAVNLDTERLCNSAILVDMILALQMPPNC